ncbi:MAG: hypothetical protein ABI343_18840 [Burkholderiaceae bacterium]
MIKIRKFWLVASAMTTALVLYGCGGGGGGGDGGGNVEAASVPDSASASVSAFIAFIAGLSGSDETSEPLVIGDTFAAPTDDASDPQTLS